MTDIILNGACGRMGKAIAEASSSYATRIVAGVDLFEAPCAFPLYSHLSQVRECADVVIDFTNHTATAELIAFAEQNRIPLVVATTGHTAEELDALKKLSEKVAVFHSGNMSLGVNLLIKLCREATKILGEQADIEIIEKHHNQKLDAPSGTALMIAHAIQEEFAQETEIVYDRTSRRSTRPQKEIGISAIRGGNIVGEHEVMFCIGNEVISIKHSAIGRALFAQGALSAAAFIKTKQSGFYSMDDLLREAVKQTSACAT